MLILSLKIVCCSSNVEYLNDVGACLVSFVADANNSDFRVEKWRLLAFFTFTTPVQCELQSDEFLCRSTFKFDHGIFESYSIFVGTSDSVIFFNVSTLGWSGFVFLDYGSIVLSARLISLSIKPYLAHSFSSLKLLNKFILHFFLRVFD